MKKTDSSYPIEIDRERTLDESIEIKTDKHTHWGSFLFFPFIYHHDIARENYLAASLFVIFFRMKIFSRLFFVRHIGLEEDRAYHISDNKQKEEKDICAT